MVGIFYHTSCCLLGRDARAKAHKTATKMPPTVSHAWVKLEAIWDLQRYQANSMVCPWCLWCVFYFFGFLQPSWISKALVPLKNLGILKSPSSHVKKWPQAPEDHQKASEPHRPCARVRPTSFTDPLVFFGAGRWLVSQNACKQSQGCSHLFHSSPKDPR